MAQQTPAPVQEAVSVGLWVAVFVSSEQFLTSWGRCLRGQVSAVFSCPKFHFLFFFFWGVHWALSHRVASDPCFHRVWNPCSLPGGRLWVDVELMFPLLSVSGPLELVLEVFAVLLKTLESPESSPTVPQMGSGRLAQLGTFSLKNASNRGCQATAQSGLSGCSGTHL